jgi:hypothetical protein
LASSAVLYLAVAAIRLWAPSPNAQRRNRSSLGYIAVIGVGLLFVSLQHLLGDKPQVLAHPVSSGLVLLNVAVVAYSVYLLVASLIAVFRGRAGKRPD